MHEYLIISLSINVKTHLPICLIQSTKLQCISLVFINDIYNKSVNIQQKRNCWNASQQTGLHLQCVMCSRSDDRLPSVDFLSRLFWRIGAGLFCLNYSEIVHLSSGLPGFWWNFSFSFTPLPPTFLPWPPDTSCPSASVLFPFRHFRHLTFPELHFNFWGPSWPTRLGETQ